MAVIFTSTTPPTARLLCLVALTIVAGASTEGAAVPEALEALEAGSRELLEEAGPALGEVDAAASNSTDQGCLAGEHRCLDGTCISKERLCDGPRDCYDGSDEDVSAGCSGAGGAAANATGDAEWWMTPTPEGALDGGVDDADGGRRTTRACGPKEFQCGDGSCVSKSVVCDEKPDCPDGTDEQLACPTRMRKVLAVSHCNSRMCIMKAVARVQLENCTDFKCSDGPCVPFEWVCDSQVDCLDGSDENPKLCAKLTTSDPKTSSVSTSSGDPCLNMEPLHRQQCWEKQIQNLKEEELQLRERVANQQLETAQMQATATKDLHLQKMETERLQQRVAEDLLKQQQEIHELRLQILRQTLENSHSTSRISTETAATTEILAEGTDVLSP